MSGERVARIVSGGQTGADRAALDAAVEAGVPYAGWCPVGGWAEDLPWPPGLLDAYPLLREAPSPDPAVRTRLNVRDSHATLVIRDAHVPSAGTDFTLASARDLGRPYLVTHASGEEVGRWLASLGRELTLNVAGPRESEQPGIYAAARILLTALLGQTR